MRSPAAAMVDRLVQHAEILSLKGDSYRLKDRDLGRVAPVEPPSRQGALAASCSASPSGLGSARSHHNATRSLQLSTGAATTPGGAFSTGAKGCVFGRP
jgi:IstB-like ATP binding protein